MEKQILIKPPHNFLLKNIIIGTKLEDIYKNDEILIDKCLAQEIQTLWQKGIHTRGCCCGHGKETGSIEVERTDLGKMIELGYEWYTDYPDEFGGKNRFDAFIPKSKCYCGIKEKRIVETINKNITSTKPISVIFIRSNGEELPLGEVYTLQDAEIIIENFLDEHNYISYYWRINFYPEYLEYDVGSWTESFKVCDNGIFRIKEER